MALIISQGIPPVLVAGDAVSFTVSDFNFPAPTWSAQVVFKDGANAVKLFSGTNSGSDHLFALSNANTATLTPGRNLACLVFSDGTNRKSSDWFEVEVFPDPAASQVPSYAQAQVTLLQTVIAKFNASGYASVNFSGQSFTRAALPEYQKQLTYWEARWLREQKKADFARGLNNPRMASPEFARGPSSVFGAIR
jgi:hypothetical protein